MWANSMHFSLFLCKQLASVHSSSKTEETQGRSVNMVASADLIHSKHKSFPSTFLLLRLVVNTVYTQESERAIYILHIVEGDELYDMQLSVWAEKRGIADFNMKVHLTRVSHEK